MSAFGLLAITAGAAIALQATMNAQLGILLKSSFLATGFAFFMSGLVTILVMVIVGKNYPDMSDIKSVPWYLWLGGGLLSAFGVGMFYYLIPQMGVGSMMSYALTGQLLIALVASHFGWFNLPITTINHTKLLGAVLLIGGMILINWDSNREF